MKTPTIPCAPSPTFPGWMKATCNNSPEKAGLRYYRLEQTEALTPVLRNPDLGQQQRVNTDLRWLLAGLPASFYCCPAGHKRTSSSPD
ncbi:MAG: hypothetical protein R3E89_14600 [Thiolinea sp.]